MIHLKRIQTLTFALLLMTSSAMAGEKIVGSSPIFYSAGDPKSVAESQMWKRAFQLCRRDLPLRLTPVQHRTVYRNNGSMRVPTQIDALAEFDCVPTP